MLIRLLIFLTLLHPQNLPADDQKVPISSNEAIGPLPYSWNDQHQWDWTHDGALVGKTSIRLIPASNQQKEWTLDARLRWSREGRSIDLRQRTDYQNQSLNPLRTRREGQIGALGAGERRFVTACEITGAEVRVVTQSPFEGTQVDRVLPFPEGTVLLENQCFEHWLVIAARLQQNKADNSEVVSPQNFSALIPSEFRMLQIQLTRDREEMNEDVTVTRWSVSCLDFKAKIWIDSAGRLERYRQGAVEIRRTRIEPEAPASDKPASDKPASDKQDSSEG